MLTKSAAPAPFVAGGAEYTPTRLASWLPTLLALLGAFLLWLGWPVHPAALAVVLLVAWVPYLRMEQVLTERGASGWKVWRYGYLLLVLWNAFTTYWVSYSTLGGGITAVVCNALLMSLPLTAFYHTKKRFGPKLGYLSLPIYWLAFEQLHLHWFLTWPWLTLGNGFAQANYLVQWYEYTGFLGGSLWMWMVNLLVFRAWFGRQGVAPWSFGQGRFRWVAPVLATAVPITISLVIGRTYQEKGPAAEVLVIQPNVDPFEEKFEGGSRFIPHAEQLARMLTLTEQNLTPQTKLVLWPETSLDETYPEETFESHPNVYRIRQWLAQHPGVELMTGLTTAVRYPSKEAASPTARFREDVGYYDIFNASVHFRTASDPAEFYHKSRLVPGVEGVPPWLSAFVIDLGAPPGASALRPSVPCTKLPRPACRWLRLSVTNRCTATLWANT
ncbi:apolipoprotein N-acyltransferase [Hymenobacter sp. AT01-02]|uniref:apolipoprotein N-acyltransferase n=1 Tax=Hymenobacter sp. AT01-02 TaxID=1571877 RepID=UPI000AF76C6C|nr:apolipoprotein N-acyltransferase [Hymenobacter sp. AT01-02]